MKNRTKKILVTGANGDIALAIGRVLNTINQQFIVYGADLGEKWPGSIVFSEIFVLPRADEAEYITALIKLFESEGFDLIIPATEPELTCLMENHCLVKHLPLLMNSPEILKVCLNKQLTSDWLEQLGVSVPTTKPLSEAREKDLPVFVKPRSGSGSRGLSSVFQKGHLAMLQQSGDVSEYVVQELLEPNEGEYTCALFKAYGELRTLIMRRWLVGGMTGKMVICSNSEIEEQLAKVARGLPEVAVINVQLRVVNNKVKIFEINPRLSSTVMMRHKVGFSDLIWWIMAREDVKPEGYEVKEGTWVYRTYDEVVVTPEEK